MMRLAAFLALSILLALGLTQGAAAQGRPQTREGFFIGFGLGGGSFGCGGCNERETGGAGYLEIGGAVSPQLLVAGESAAWTRDADGARLTHGNISVVVQYYPSVTSGFFVKGGLGISRFEASVSDGSFFYSEGYSGLRLTAGLGYDIRLGTNFSLRPYGTFVLGTFDGSDRNHGQIGLGVTWH